MLVDLVDYRTADGVILPGGYFAATGTRKGPIDAVLLNPGTSVGFNFGALTDIAQSLAAAGYPALTISTRGHDLVFRDAVNKRYLGAAYERVSDCYLDFNAALDVLSARGYSRVALLGHSLGGAKALYYAAKHLDPRVAAIIGCSPPRWSASTYRASEVADKYEDNYRRAKALEDTGRGDELFDMTFPLGPMKFQAAGWLEKYADETYNMANYAADIRVPLLYLIGSTEIDSPAMRGVADDLMRLATESDHRRSVVIDGADHFYSGGKTRDVAAAIIDWLDTLALD